MTGAGAGGPPMVATVSDLRVHFRSKRGRVHSVDGVSFSIRDGETLGLVGETGCGKSVTGRSFLRLVPQPPAIFAGGSIAFRPHEPCGDCGGAGCGACDGTGRRAMPCPSCRGGGCEACEHTGSETIDLLRVPDARMRELRGDRIAMIFQDPGKSLNPTLTIGRQLSEVFLQHRSADLLEAAGIDPAAGGMGAAALWRLAHQEERRTDRWLLALPGLRARRDALRRAIADRVAAALAETQIPNPRYVMDRFPHELSGGMRQRVVIAQALACNPDLLIADEPTTALDVTVQARILELIADLQDRRGTSVLYISHDLSLVRQICERVAVMYAGRIVELGPVDRIFRDPRHPYTRGLLAAVPTAAARRGELSAIPGSVPELVEPGPGCRFAGRCSHVMPVCTRADPVFAPVAEGHAAACFLEHPPAGGTERAAEAAE